MPEKFLNRADIVTIFEKLRRETVPEGVGGSMFRDSRRLDCFLDRFLNHRLIDVVAALHAGVPVKVLATCGKHELPSPLGIRVGYLRALASGSFARPAPSRKSF